jgi:hypothetical protein
MWNCFRIEAFADLSLSYLLYCGAPVSPLKKGAVWICQPSE